MKKRKKRKGEVRGEGEGKRQRKGNIEGMGMGERTKLKRK